jgi:hypothetical protein
VHSINKHIIDYRFSGQSHKNKKKPKIQAFIFSWPNWSIQAELLEETLVNTNFFDKVFVINSDPHFRKDNWINLGEQDYFSSQFEAALTLFNGDIFFHIQADVTIPKYINLIEFLNSAIENFYELNFSVYAPDIDYTAWDNESAIIKDSVIKFLGYPEKIKPVVNTDCSCWFINSVTLEEFKDKYLDNLVKNSRFGWGVSGAMCAIGWKNKMPAIRNLNYQLIHPKNTNYDVQKAILGYKIFCSETQDSFVKKFLLNSIFRNLQGISCLIYKNFKNQDVESCG